MKKQISLLLVFLCFFFPSVDAQELNQEFVPGISIGTRKSVVIDSIMSNLRLYFEADIDGVLNFTRKKYGVSIKNKNKFNAFIIQMQDDVRTMLQVSDNWQTVDTYRKYGFSVNKVLGLYVGFSGYGKRGEGRNGDGYLDVYFKDGYASAMYGSLDITKDYSIHSGFNYDNDHLSGSAAVLRNNYGNFTFIQSATTWNSCSANPENVPVITYNFNNDEEYIATFTFTYGVYQRRLTGGAGSQCRVAGNHLTNIAFYVAGR